MTYKRQKRILYGNVLRSFRTTTCCRRRDTLSRLEFFKVNVKLQLGIYNGVVLSWREKVLNLRQNRYSGSRMAAAHSGWGKRGGGGAWNGLLFLWSELIGLQSSYHHDHPQHHPRAVFCLFRSATMLRAPLQWSGKPISIEYRRKYCEHQLRENGSLFVRGRS